MSSASQAPHGDLGPVLTVRDLEVTFPTARGPLRAVGGISYSIDPGRTLGVVGESGCGKSVSALAVLGLVPPPGQVTGGTIALGTLEVTAMDEDALPAIRGERVSMIFQEPMTALNPVLSVGQQIAEAWALHRAGTAADAREAALTMLERVRIPNPVERYANYPHQMSGGMRQRAMIAMALACGPELLIADEPTTALDVTIQAQIIELMMEMQAEFGMAIQFISHNLGVVSEIADDVMVMYAGHIVEMASTEQIFSNPRHPYTRALMETVPRLGARATRLPTIAGTVPDLLDLPPGCPFSDRCPLADEGCRQAAPTLDDLGGGHLAACFKAREDGP
ncbi:MAG: ABC transporter ATP-binding protein [Alphaproteobacteria bacterium]|nr:ABC transporter ATP-binding protein [Alphaproteobacteria bacterium]